VDLLDHPRRMFVDASGQGSINIPRFLGASLGFVDTDEIFIGLEPTTNKDNAARRVWISRYEMTRHIGQVTCTMRGPAGVHRLSDVASSMNLKTLLVQPSSIDGEDCQHVTLVFSWTGATIMLAERSRYFLLSERISHMCGEDIVSHSSGGVDSTSLIVRPLFIPVLEQKARVTVTRGTQVVGAGKLNIAKAEDWDVAFPSNLEADLRRQLGVDEDSALEYLLSADTDIPVLRVDFPIPRRWTVDDMSVEAASTLIRFTVVFADRPGLIAAVWSKLRGHFEIVRSFVRRDRNDGPYSARLEMTVTSNDSVRDALQQQALLHNVFSQVDVKSVFVNQERFHSDTPRIFVAYDFGRVELAALICTKLSGAVVVTGHCEDDSADWQRFVREQMAHCDGLLGVIPNRHTGPSRNLIWEYEQVEEFGIPSQWLVSDQIQESSRPRGANVTAFDERHPAPALSQSLQQLFCAISTETRGK
jgi:hypothetical protein